MGFDGDCDDHALRNNANHSAPRRPRTADHADFRWPVAVKVNKAVGIVSRMCLLRPLPNLPAKNWALYHTQGSLRSVLSGHSSTSGGPSRMASPIGSCARTFGMPHMERSCLISRPPAANRRKVKINIPPSVLLCRRQTPSSMIIIDTCSQHTSPLPRYHPPARLSPPPQPRLSAPHHSPSFRLICNVSSHKLPHLQAPQRLAVSAPINPSAPWQDETRCQLAFAAQKSDEVHHRRAPAKCGAKV